MPSARSNLGTRGEALAAAHLEGLGMCIATRNYRSRYGEVDLVAHDGDTLVFVEVKTRRTNSYGTPEESITPRKLDRLAKTAARYLQEHGLEQRPWRVDLVAIKLGKDGPTFNHVRSIVERDPG
ncbi:MAG: YraN family protein [Chloroflexi bacterium]|nr:YraN family protein [Chloroflexota bacterium]